MDVIGWILFGLIAGVVANAIDPHPASGGLLGAIVLGVLGALVGGFLANLIFGVTVTGFNFTSFAIAVVGSLVVLYIGRAFRRA